MLKLKLTTIEGLPAEIAKEYKKDGDVYVLDTDVPWEDTTQLKNSLLQERTAHKETKKEKEALATSVADLTARAGNATDLEKSWQTKLSAAEAAAKAKQDGLSAQLQKLLVDNVAQTVAGSISTTPELLLPHIKGRLTVAEEDGQYVTRVLGEDGKVSATTVKELQESLLADKRFAPLVTGSRASGGGANGNKAGAGGKSFGEMSEAERTQLYHSDRTKFNTARAEWKASQGQAATAAT